MTRSSERNVGFELTVRGVVEEGVDGGVVDLFRKTFLGQHLFRRVGSVRSESGVGITRLVTLTLGEGEKETC